VSDGRGQGGQLTVSLIQRYKCVPSQEEIQAGTFFCALEAVLRITRGDGLIDRDQAARLCGVSPDAVTLWSTRGYLSRDGKTRYWLPVEKREGRKPLYKPLEVAKADYHTRKRAGRETPRDLAAAA
jgi:hypothetical protein